MRKFLIALFSLILMAVFTSAEAGVIEKVCVDDDVGITTYQDNTYITIDIQNLELQNYQEVEISPGDRFILVSSTTIDVQNYDYLWIGNETLQGSLYIKNADWQKENFDNSNNRFVLAYTESNYTPNETILSKDHFRLDRSRCYIYTGNIEQIQNAQKEKI